jgi:lipopolysaccharide/colanic/teichoic acid biosynthesis glycosyltransferase/glycosyltransferase involved in cell wall biosynthesis
MNVVYFHQHFNTPAGSVGTRSYEFARRLVARGHAVTIVCGSYRTAVTGLSGPFMSGKRTGVVDGINVIELELPVGNSDGLAARALAFLRFAGRSTRYALTTDYDVVYATSTPLTAAIPGIAAARLRRKLFMFEVRDLWPELPKAMGAIRNPLVLGALGVLEKVAYRSARRCVGLAPGIVEGIKRHGTPDDRVHLIPNAADLDLFGATASAEPWRPDGVAADDLMAVFTGTHGTANGLGAVLDAAALLKARGSQRIKIVLIGEGKEKPALMARAKAEGLDHVVFHAAVPKTKLAGLMRSADVGLMVLANVPAFYYGTSPNKFFDYIATGIPVLNNYPGWIAGMIDQHGCGIAVPPNDAKAMADAIERFEQDRPALSRMGAQARALAVRDFDRQKLADQFVDLVERSAVEAPALARSSLLGDGLKRGLDLVAGIVAGLLLLPVMLLVALLVRTKLGSPVLFRQERPGRDGRPFEMLKFRTMTDARGSDGALLPDSERLTRFGRLLRSTSLDELPELWNIVRGDMSLVGPRPLLVEYMAKYSPRQALRHLVRPGLTGWAQINGRNKTTWPDRLELDAWYVENRSFWLDLKILARTVLKVLRCDGIDSADGAPMPKFEGQGR